MRVGLRSFAYVAGVLFFVFGLFMTFIVHELYSGKGELTGQTMNLRGFFFKDKHREGDETEFLPHRPAFNHHVAIQSLESREIPSSSLENVYVKEGDVYEEEIESETLVIKSNPMDEVKSAMPRVDPMKALDEAVVPRPPYKEQPLIQVGVGPHFLGVPPGGKISKSRRPETLVAGPGKKLVGSTPTKSTDCDKLNESRYYKVGRRKDFKSSIADALTTLKLCEQQKSSGYDFYWDETFDQRGDSGEIEKYFSVNIKSGAMVSSIPGVRETIGLKPSLARIHRQCLKKLESHELCSFTKRAFNFERKNMKLKIEDGPENFVNFAYSLTKRESSQAEWPQLWIFKPQESYLGMGIRLLKIFKKDIANKKGIANWAVSRFPDGKWTLQEYVRNSALYKGKKFDIRAWSLLVSIRPLRIVTLSYGFPKVSTVDYNPSPEHFEDLCMHIKMPLGPDCQAQDLVKPYPKNTGKANWKEHVKFNKGLQIEWDKDIWSQVEDQISIVVLGGLEAMRGREAQIFGDNVGRMNSYRRFAFLSPDFAVDDKGKVYMEEMNTNGFMIGDTYSHFFPAQSETILIMRVLGADGFPDSWKYQEDAEKVVDKYCAGAGFDDCEKQGVKKEILRMIHEDMSGGEVGGKIGSIWKRSFPPRENEWPGIEKVMLFWDRYVNLMHNENDRKWKWYAKKFDRGDHTYGKDFLSPHYLDLATWNFIEWRRNIALGKEDDMYDKGFRALVLKTCPYCKLVVSDESTSHKMWYT